MPRPGPRPYECVRRAWHSDRHQPMRGSLIQEIFRVVNEIHSPASKKNKEWQEKLPIVVLKAEEIMYSKANSEAEYMDFKTVLKRTNDAIDVIIRRDESTESGDLLQPCIEAALNLGCTPRRASRSQRLSNPRFYLSSSPHETAEASVPPKISGSTTFRGSHPLQPQSTKHVPHTSPQYASYYSTRLAPFTVNSTRIGSQPTPLAHANLPSGAHNQFLLSPENFSLSQQDNHSCSMDVHPSTSFGHAYPLYYGTTALVQPVLEPKTSFLQNFTSCNTGLDGCSRTIQPSLNLGGTSEYRPRVEFDLSLRLGSLSAPSPSMEDKWNSAVEDVGFPTSCDATRLCDLSLRTRTSHFDCSASSVKREKEFCFFPTADHPIAPHPSGQSSRGHDLDVETAIRKHKAPTDGCGEDLQLYWQMNPSSSQFFGRTKRSNS